MCAIGQWQESADADNRARQQGTNLHLQELNGLLQNLVGERVTDKLVAGNSVSVWFSVRSNDANARGVWIDPPWRIEGPHGVEASSHGFPQEQEEGESDAEYRARFERACERSDLLKGLRLVAVSVDLALGDIALAFEAGRTLRSFSTETDWEFWHYEDCRVGKKYRVLGRVVDVEMTDA